jgi:hypothetical protein
VGIGVNSEEFGSERESGKVRILCGFYENKELGLGGSQALRF